jgi:hypothetical protein
MTEPTVGGILKDLIEGNVNLISLIIAFTFLPSFYLRSAFSIQKEYVDLAKTIFSSPTLSRSHKGKLAERSEEALQVFQLEPALVCAMAILVLANFSTAYIVELSSFAKNGCVAAPSQGVPLANPAIICGKVKSWLAVYSVVTILLIFFQMSWARLTAMRRLRRIYEELSVAAPQEPRKVSKPSPVRSRT